MDMKLSMTEIFAKQLLDRMVRKRELSRIDYLKCKLGIEVFLLNITKMIVIYSLACLVTKPLEVLIFHSAFMLIRFFAYGAHSSSSIGCTIISSVLFIGIPVLLDNMTFSSTQLLIANLFNLLILLKYAPGKTRKNHVGDVRHQNKLRKNALLANMVLMTGIFISNEFIGSLLVFGGLLCGLLVIPIANKILTLDFKI